MKNTTNDAISLQTPAISYDTITYQDPIPLFPQNSQGIVAVIPAYNEEKEIYTTLENIKAGTIWPDLTLIIVNNSTDDTLQNALDFQKENPDFPLAIHNIEGLTGKKTGALCYAWSVLKNHNYKYFISMDADVILDQCCLEDLYEEINNDETIGGVAARYNFLPNIAKGPIERWWLFCQRIDFSMWTAGLLKETNRETYVLGGQVSILRREAMQQICELDNREYPWSTETAVEDMELTWRINDIGYTTRCSDNARAWVGAMPNRSSLWGQRTKWDRGIVDLLRTPGMKTTSAHYLKEPKRQQWRSFTDMMLRILLYTALPLALLRGSYEVFTQWWMPLLAFTPIFLSMIIGFLSALYTPQRRILDIILATIYFPLEIYVWFRTALWARSWIGSLRGEKQDLWAAQAASEGQRTTSNRNNTSLTISETR